MSRGANPLACTDKGRVLYKNVGGVSVVIQSLQRDRIMSINCVRLSRSSCIVCVHEVVCGGWTRLLPCDLEVGVDCALTIYSRVEFAVPKTACCQFYQAGIDWICSMRGGSVKLLGRIMRSCPEVHSETTPDPWFSADTLPVKQWMVTTIRTNYQCLYCWEPTASSRTRSLVMTSNPVCGVRGNEKVPEYSLNVFVCVFHWPVFCPS